MSWRTMNRRRRERSRYAWLGVQATSSSLAVSDPVRLLMMAPDMLDSDAVSRCANRPRDCCRGVDTGQVGAGPRPKLLEYAHSNRHTQGTRPCAQGEGLFSRQEAANALS